MSEMIQKVASEISRQRAIRIVEASGCDPLRIKAWSTDARDFQDAAVAIKAMREPTEAMIQAGMACADVDLASEYRAMIDAALEGVDKIKPMA